MARGISIMTLGRAASTIFILSMGAALGTSAAAGDIGVRVVGGVAVEVTGSGRSNGKKWGSRGG